MSTALRRLAAITMTAVVVLTLRGFIMIESAPQGSDDAATGRVRWCV